MAEGDESRQKGRQNEEERWRKNRHHAHVPAGGRPAGHYSRVPTAGLTAWPLVYDSRLALVSGLPLGGIFVCSDVVPRSVLFVGVRVFFFFAVVCVRGDTDCPCWSVVLGVGCSRSRRSWSFCARGSFFPFVPCLVAARRRALSKYGRKLESARRNLPVYKKAPSYNFSGDPVVFGRPPIRNPPIWIAIKDGPLVARPWRAPRKKRDAFARTFPPTQLLR